MSPYMKWRAWPTYAHAAGNRASTIKDRGIEVDSFTAEESRALVASARDAEERALFLFPPHTGDRAGEQRAIEWGDNDWRRRNRRPRRSLIRRPSSRQTRPDVIAVIRY
jgi:integrase